MKPAKIFLFLFVCAVLQAYPAHADLEPSYNSGKPRAITPWYETTTPQSRAADLNFMAGMRPHHAGALTMSQEYLANTDATNPLLKQLARSIIHNQSFEIEMLDKVEAHLKMSQDSVQPSRQQIATKGLAQSRQFYRMPMPGFLDRGIQADTASAADVKFAKAMIVHHQGALDMCNSYLSDPDLNNGYLELMCLEILRDQSQEIAFMESIIRRYPGDADLIPLDPSMVHGMEAMHHAAGKHHNHMAPSSNKHQAHGKQGT